MAVAERSGPAGGVSGGREAIGADGRPGGRLGDTGCIACGSPRLHREYSVVSPYLAFKAWHGPPEPVAFFVCADCDCRFYGRGLSDEEVVRYYRDYRSEDYFRERRRFEPFYTRARYEADARFQTAERRRRELADLLARAGMDGPFDLVLDYGGGEGWLVRDLAAARKIVFDVPGATAPPGIEVVSELSALSGGADLVTCAHVLEHLADPAAALVEIAALLRPGGAVYLEVPDQLWRPPHRLRPSPGMLSRLCRHPTLLLLADLYGTAVRVKFGRLPPFGFVPMREHINFLTDRALHALATRAGLQVLAHGRLDRPDFFLVAVKR